MRSLNFNKLLGGGVLHTKLWIIDRKHFYLGSANMDWRSLTQVKEMGVVGYNCSCIVDDLGKIFDVGLCHLFRLILIFWVFFFRSIGFWVILIKYRIIGLKLCPPITA